ncbi:MAG: hypothetical protein K2G75_03120, partial [Muribaculaceae bacterium]|nr:hypothetical protein [Muribaculaceae bacterium]
GKRECILVTLVLGQRAIYTEMAYRWENGDADALAQLMVSEDPNLLTQGTYEDLKLSVLHNAVILNHEDGVLLPSGPAENLYSPEQIAWLNSDEVQKHYNSIPTVLSSETGTYVSPMFMPYESRIASAYVTGLRQLGQLSVSQTYVSSRDLCKEYTKVVQEDSGVSEETVGNLISTFYMGPVSAKCWKTHLGY